MEYQILHLKKTGLRFSQKVDNYFKKAALTNWLFDIWPHKIICYHRSVILLLFAVKELTDYV